MSVAEYEAAKKVRKKLQKQVRVPATPGGATKRRDGASARRERGARRGARMLCADGATRSVLPGGRRGVSAEDG